MPNKYLMRGDAPLGAESWDILDTAAVETAKGVLAGRRILPVEGPFGLGLASVPLWDVRTESGLIASDVLPLLMIHETFSLSLRDLAKFERERMAFMTNPVVEAARRAARLEDNLVFRGGPGVGGLLTVNGANHVQLSAWDEVGTAANDIIRALTMLNRAGFYGPYAIALAPSRYDLLFRLYPMGTRTELEHIRLMAMKGVFRAPVLDDGGVVVDQSPLYVSIVLGQDLQVGFVGPTEYRLEFSVSESLTLRILQPQSICVLEG